MSLLTPTQISLIPQYYGRIVTDVGQHRVYVIDSYAKFFKANVNEKYLLIRQYL